MTSASDDAPLDPAGMLELLERQQSDVHRRTAKLIPWILFAWGVTWLVGYGALWLVDGLGPAFSLPLGVAVAVFVGLMAVSVALSAVLGGLSGRGMKASKQSNFTGAVFGCTCSVAFLAIYVVGAQLSALGMPAEVANVYFPVMYTLIIGILYLLAGAIWRAVPSVVLGGLLAAVALAAGFSAYPTPYLVIAVAGGGVFLAGGLVIALWVRGRFEVPRR